MSVARLLRRPEAYRISIYRPAPDGVGAHHQQLSEWPLVAADLPMIIQHVGGSLTAEPIGVVIAATYPVFADHGADIQPGDGVQIDGGGTVAAMLGRRFRIKSGLDWGPRGGWQGVAEDTDEIFGAVPAS